MTADLIARAEFEVWYLDTYGQAPERDGAGYFLNGATNSKWIGWQAALASRSEGWQDISTAPKDGTGIATYWQERWNMSRSKQEVFAALLFHYCSVSQSLGTAGSAPPQQGAHIKTDAEIRYDAKHDNSCIGAFARARPTRVPK